MVKRFQDMRQSVEYLVSRERHRRFEARLFGRELGSRVGAGDGVPGAAFPNRGSVRGRTVPAGRSGRQRPTPFNFLPRVRVPVLMLNGRYDYTFPVESSQRPFFRWLGTPEKDKRHVLYDAAHDVMVNRTEVVKEVLSWLDQYLGPVAR